MPEPKSAVDTGDLLGVPEDERLDEDDTPDDFEPIDLSDVEEGEYVDLTEGEDDGA